jgi:predicted DNA-binding transcriptional regulator YafY
MSTGTRHQPLIRCLRLVRFLEGRRHLPSLSVMARELGVCERTIRRYLAALEEAYWSLPAKADAGELGEYSSAGDPSAVIHVIPRVARVVHREH